MEEAVKRIYYHTEHTDCLTYFQITGQFDPNEITAYLRLAPERVRHARSVSGSSAGQPAMWRFGSCAEYDANVSRQMMQTLEQLLPKEDLLRRIKLIYGAKLELHIVPIVRYDEPAPLLSPSMAVMRFCVSTGTELCVDLYVSCPDDLAGRQGEE